MYVVVRGEAIMLENGTPYSYLIDENGTIDWDTQDLLAWDDMTPREYSLYKEIYDFLLDYQNLHMYVK